MSVEAIQTFPDSHDPDDVASRNITVGAMVRHLKGIYADADVFLAASNTDSDLAISIVAYDADEETVSFRITGGSKTNQAVDSDGKLRTGYLITCRIFLVDGRHYDRSYWQLIRDH